MDDVRLSFILRRYIHLNFCSALVVFMPASVILAGRRSIVVLSGVKNQKTGMSPIGEIRVEHLLQGLSEQGIHKFLVASCS